MSKQIKAKYIGDGEFRSHLMDTSSGTVYEGKLLDLGEMSDLDRAASQEDEFQFTDDSGDTVVTRLCFGWEVVEG